MKKELKPPFHNHGAKLVSGEARKCQECINKTFVATLENIVTPQPVPLKDSASDYVMLASPKTHCPYEHVLHAKHPDVLHHIMLLQPEDLTTDLETKDPRVLHAAKLPQFYICFNCNRVFEVGKGEVQKI